MTSRVCKFYLQGNCKFGDQCKFEHPPGRGAAQPAQSQNNFLRPPQDQSRYSGFGRGNQSYAPRNQRGGTAPRDSRDNRSSRDPRPYGVTRDVLEEDLLRERPMWIMSGYGPGKDADIQLFGGFPLEQSPEEIRTLHYQAVASGNVQQSAQMEAELAAKSNEQVQAVLNDISGALHYLENGANEHPNRNDICRANTSRLQRNGNGPFSRSTRHGQLRHGVNQAAQSGFQQQQPQQPGFGQAPQNTGFGAPNPAQPTGLGQPTGFGLQPQPQSTGFGQTPPLGFGTQPAPTGFGAPAAPLNNQQFGQNNTPFGQPDMNTAFAQPGIQQPHNAFNAMPQQQPPQNPSPFGAQPIQPPIQQQPQQQQPMGLFGQPAPPAQPMTNGFGAPQQQPQQQQQQQPSGFGGFNGGGGPPPPANGDVQSYTTRDASNKLLTWKGRSVDYINGQPCYRLDDGSWERIWFPDGPPASASASASAGEGGGPAAEAVEYPGEVREAYTVLRETGRFKDGVVPDMAPSGDMVRWDL